MAKTEDNIKKNEEFIRRVLADNFGQKIEGDELRRAAERLCVAMPPVRQAA